MTLARVVATWFGSGLAPRAPGTVGTLASLPLAVALALPVTPRWALPLVLLLVFAVGTWAADRVAHARGLKDPSEVVIDETAGLLLACLGGPPCWQTLAGAFVAFRLFDIVKPWPVRPLERLPGGWGIMADDLAAGLLAALFLWLGWGMFGGEWAGWWGSAAGAGS